MQGNAAKVTRNAAFLTRVLTRVPKRHRMFFVHYREIVTPEKGPSGTGKSFLRPLPENIALTGLYA